MLKWTFTNISELYLFKNNAEVPGYAGRYTKEKYEVHI